VEKDADPLLCPTGYFCSIFDEGEPEKGIPNQGTCLKLPDGAVDPDDKLYGDDDEDDDDDEEDEDEDDEEEEEEDYKEETEDEKQEGKEDAFYTGSTMAKIIP
jgi:hypothetical protein